MSIWLIILIVLVVISIMITILAYIGLKVKKTEKIVKKQIENERKKQRRLVHNAKLREKYKRQRTPRV